MTADEISKTPPSVASVSVRFSLDEGACFVKAFEEVMSDT